MREREALHAENRRMRALLRDHADWHAGSDEYDQSKMGIETEMILSGAPGEAGESYQDRVAPWMRACFGARISADLEERCDRFLEEAVELVQALGHGRDRAHALVDYVYDKDGGAIGEPDQEVGGTMVTLAALCLAAGLDLHDAAETELARISTPETMAKIRAKQAAKPTGSALPIAFGQSEVFTLIRSERRRQVSEHGYSEAHDDEHDDGQLARAAACYAIAGGRATVTPFASIAHIWPWVRQDWSSHSRMQDLTRAAALLVAEIERLRRQRAIGGARP